MRKPPPVSQFFRFPITAGLCLLAIGVTIAWHTGHSIDALAMSGLHLWDQPWRMITSIFPHAGIFHIAFNVYWTWVFGTLLEKEIGTLRFLLVILILAAGSGVAELAIFEGGVGLSGVGYGLFGMLWVLARRDPRFAQAIDQSTIKTFVGWFFLCIVLTVFKIMPIANVAHGMGAVLGALMGWIYTSRAPRRQILSGGLVLLLLVIGLAATLFRPWVNFSPAADSEYINAAYTLLQAEHPQEALPLLQKAVQFRGDDGTGWYDLGICYEQLGMPERALPCFRRAVSIKPGEDHYRAALENAEKAAAVISPTSARTAH